jgi:hypothetical protein
MEALEKDLDQAKLEIYNIEQGAQFISEEFT